MATQVQQQKVRFLSQFSQLRMQRQTQGEIILPNANVTNDPSRPEVTYEFEHGALTLRVGQDMLPDKVDPETGEVVEQDAIDWIRSRPEYGASFIEVEPVAPDPGPLYVQIGELAAAGDLDGLIALGDAENESWGREAVLDQIREAVERLSTKA